jgi:hypothetical protein
MDRITKALLAEFVDQNGLNSLTEDKAFEHFAGYLVTSSFYSESFSTDDISVGAGNDGGIDCIAIIVNGALVTEPEEVEDLAETNSFLDVAFIFTQAERSSAFDTAKIGQFSFGVTDFFSETPKLPQNDKIQLSHRITKEILDRSRFFRNGNPQCLLYYVTTGKWVDDQNLTVRRDSARRDIEALGLFRNVAFECVDAEKIQKLYRASQNSISTEIIFAKRSVIPEMPGVDQAYIGVLPATEYLKLIENEHSEMVTSIFYDNVRHWQEWNPVNKEIRGTLDDPTRNLYFPLLNNGVTIVAKALKPTGDKFLVEDYQIVNGCQSSYVLHECRSNLVESIMIPIRLIATQDEAIKNSIIKATNRQTEVTEDQLFALSDFPKKLESYFPSFNEKCKLYYERRSRQYSDTTGIEKIRIINMTVLIRAFASMYLEQPHRTTRNYKFLLKSIGKEIFGKDHRLEPYYASAFAHYRLEYLFRRQVLESSLKPARYHILLACKYLVQRGPLPRMNSNEMKRYCEKFIDILWDEDKSRRLFEEAAKIVYQVSAGDLHRDNVRTEPFTSRLITEILKNNVFRIDENAKITGPGERLDIDKNESDDENASSWEFTDPVLMGKKRDKIIDAFAQKNEVRFTRKSQALYWDAGHSFRIACTVSKRYTRRDANPYWYAYHSRWNEFLIGTAASYFILGCMDLNIAFAIPADVIRQHLDELNMTKRRDGAAYWHIKILEQQPNVYSLQMPKSGNHLDLSQYSFELVNDRSLKG